jgi:hypothetical protein
MQERDARQPNSKRPGDERKDVGPNSAIARLMRSAPPAFPPDASTSVVPAISPRWDKTNRFSGARGNRWLGGWHPEYGDGQEDGQGGGEGEGEGAAGRRIRDASRARRENKGAHVISEMTRAGGPIGAY